MAVGKKGEKTKRKIFVTAMRLFKEVGYDNVTVDEIVKEAEIAKGTFYIYFRTKAHIVAEVFTELDINYENSMKIVATMESSMDKLRYLLNDAIKIQRDYVGYDLTIIGYRAQLELHIDYSMDAERPLYKYVAEIIREGQKCGEFNQADTPVYYTKILIRSIRGAIYEWCVSYNDYDFLEDGGKYIDNLLKMLK